MSTRAFFGVRVDGATKLMYNQHDGYPRGLGEWLVAQLRTADLEKMRNRARELKLVPRPDVDDGIDGTTEKTPHGLTEVLRPGLRRFCREQGIGGTDTCDQQSKDEFAGWTAEAVLESPDYVDRFLQQLEGNLEVILEIGAYIEGGSWVGPEGLCEWGYVVEFDNLKFQVYSGGEGDCDEVPFHPNELLAEYPLAEIPEGWAEECEREGAFRSRAAGITRHAEMILACKDASQRANFGKALMYALAEFVEFDNWREALVECLSERPAALQTVVLEAIRDVHGTAILRTVAESAGEDLAAQIEALLQEGGFGDEEIG